MSELEPRASDAEREQTVATMRDASAEGRLTLEELADRTALAYRARTHGDLEALTADLPAPAGTTPPQQARRRAWLFEQIDVETSVFAVFAPVQEGSAGEVPPGAPRLRIRGFSLFGPVFVQVRRS